MADSSSDVGRTPIRSSGGRISARQRREPRREARRQRQLAAREHFTLLAITITLAVGAVLAFHRVEFSSEVSAQTRVTQPGTAYVIDSTGDGDNDPLARGCRDVLTGHCTLRAAIQISNLHAGTDDITFNIPTSDPGFSNGTWTINLGKALDPISDSVNITGPGPDIMVVQRNASTNFRIFTVTTGGTVSLTGLTITKGSAGFGGGISNGNQGTVNVTNCTLSQNSADSGGGVYNSSGGTMNVSNSTLSSNLANDVGGGIFLTGSSVNISDSMLNSNSATLGGGIYNDGFNGIVFLSNSTLRNNSATSGGGGIFNNQNGTATVTNSTLSANVATDGGGVFNWVNGTVKITSSTFGGNTATNFGGGILNNGNVTVTNSTFSRNSAGSGGGMYESTSFPFNVKSSIVALNSADQTGPDVVGPFTSSGFNLIGKTDGSTGFTASTDQTGTITAPLDPELDPNGLQNNGGPTQTIALLFGSPAIDKGTSAGLTGSLTTDQRDTGFPRTFEDPHVANAVGGDGTDIGAFEVQSASPRWIDNITRPAGRISGGQQIKLTGGFAGLSTVTMGGAPASFVYTNGNGDTSTITVTTPAHAVGAVDIVLTATTGGHLTKPNCFAYLPTVFTDDTIVAGQTTAKAQHILELRQAVDAMRAVAGLSGASWTDPGLAVGNPIKAAHIRDLRTFFDDAATRLGFSISPYTDPGLAAGFLIKRIHIEELRQRIRTIAG